MPELTIRRVDLTQSEELIPLWMAGFPTDSKEFIVRFLRNLPLNTVILSGEMDGNMVTMLFLLPATATFRGETFSVRYLYAGCTHPQYRGRGFYRELLSAAAQTVQKLGEAAIYLHPADEALVQSYRRFGYRSGIVGGIDVGSNHELLLIDSTDEYMVKRQQCIEQLSQHTVFWDVTQNTVQFYLQDALSHGATLRGDKTSIKCAYRNNVIECLGEGRVQGNEAYCLWLPIGNSPLESLMDEYYGATGMVGD